MTPEDGVPHSEKKGVPIVIHRWFEKHRELLARREEQGFDGFTLIELLIVIVVLGILAATVIFALAGVTGQTKTAACNSDAKSVEVAVEAYHSSPDNPSNAWPGSIADLTSTNKLGAKSGPFLRQAPSTTNGYTISLGTNNGNVLVLVAGTNVPVNYDTESSTAGCNSSKV